MNSNELCDILLVILGVCLIFFISTRKEKELFNLCNIELKKKKKYKKKLKVKSYDKTLSNNYNISKILSKEQIKNTINDQNIIINNLNNETESNENKSNETNLDKTNIDETKLDKINLKEPNLDETNLDKTTLDKDKTKLDNKNLDDEIDGFVKIDNYGNLDLSFPDNNITNISTSYNYNNQNLSKLNNYRNIENQYTIINQDKISNEKLDESKSINISEDDEELENISNSKTIDTSFDNNNLSKDCYKQVGGNYNQDLVYGLQQNEMKSYKEPNITRYENEKKCSTLKNAVLNLNRTGYLKSDLVEKSWNETFKPECGNL